ncbi:MAG: Asp-tRNA(Asn)/Glu-tRNA(Gln) amidotransferase subunit GatC [Candidatus Omnitrophota bacterium]
MDEQKEKNVITDETVRYAAKLARISLDAKEEVLFREQLSDILGYIEQLREVDTEGVLPTTHVLPSMKNVFREDIAAFSISTEDALLNAPDRTENFFKVPKIIKDR